MILLLENSITGGFSSVTGDRYVKPDETKKILYLDGNNLYGPSMSQSLPYDDIIFDRNVKLEDILDIDDDSDIGYFVEFDLKTPAQFEEKTKNFPFCSVNKISPKVKFGKNMRKLKPDNYTQKKC